MTKTENNRCWSFAGRGHFNPARCAAAWSERSHAGGRFHAGGVRGGLGRSIPVVLQAPSSKEWRTLPYAWGHCEIHGGLLGLLGAPGFRVLDPGSGTGILSAAVCEAACNGAVNRLHIDAYETDPLLACLTRFVLSFAGKWLAKRGVALTFEARHGDFVLDNAAAFQSTTKANGQQVGGVSTGYDLVISNPPYFKIGKDDPRAVAWASVVHGQPNIYALFMAISAELLSESGELVYIVPRSFASGPYFRRFREVFFQRVAPTAIHLFESRRDVFRNQTVLQENLVLTARRRGDGEALDEGQVLISHSRGADDLAYRRSIQVNVDSVLDLASENRELSIPLCSQDLELVRAVRNWPSTLRSLGMEISTGPGGAFQGHPVPDAGRRRATQRSLSCGCNTSALWKLRGPCR